MVYCALILFFDASDDTNLSIVYARISLVSLLFTSARWFAILPLLLTYFNELTNKYKNRSNIVQTIIKQKVNERIIWIFSILSIIIVHALKINQVYRL